MTAPNPSRLDAGQVLQGAYDEATGRLRTDAEATIVNAEIDVDIDASTSSVAIGDATTGDKATVTPDGEVSVVVDANTSSIEVFQIDPDGLNTNAHLQVAGQDVADENPVPTKDVSLPNKILIDQTSLTTYIGEAISGSSVGSSVWRIQRITKSGSVTSIEQPQGNPNFIFSWDLRATYVYS